MSKRDLDDGSGTDEREGPKRKRLRQAKRSVTVKGIEEGGLQSWGVSHGAPAVGQPAPPQRNVGSKAHRGKRRTRTVSSKSHGANTRTTHTHTHKLKTNNKKTTKDKHTDPQTTNSQTQQTHSLCYLSASLFIFFCFVRRSRCQDWCAT